MGCNCGGQVNREKLDKLIKANQEMAKTKYKLAKGVSENSRLINRGHKVYAGKMTQVEMGLFYKMGHPAIVLDEEKHAKKDK